MQFKLKFFIPFLLCFFLVGSPLSHALDTITPKKTEQVAKQEVTPVQAHLLSEVQSVKPGEKFWVGVELQMADGWDTYWINPGDAGIPTNVTWHLPENFQVSTLHWPYPEKFVNDTMVGFGYTHSVMLLAEITPPQNLPEGPLEIKADVQWLACKEQCMPGKADLSLTLPVKAAPNEKNPATAAQFSHARSHLPLSLSNNALTAFSNKEEIVLNFQPGMGDFGEITEAFFVPEKGEVIDYGAPQKLQKTKESYSLNIKKSSSLTTPPEVVKGVLIVGEKGSSVKKAIHVDTTLSQTPVTPTAAASNPHSYSFELALLCAFVGGMILNVMPCVLPVVALKIFSFVKMAQQDRREIFKQGGLFAAGVVASFWVLSALLLILRASGEGIGWGFQLQEPMFVATLIIILFLLGLSLLGVFELGTSMIGMGEKLSSKGGFFKGSFMSGVLATLVATPCTGPLLGPAVGLAMTMPAVGSLAIFTAMGVGMAAPYLVFAAFPQLIRFLPKPGNWMVLFKQLLGFLMMGTCIWLIWVFGGETSHFALLILLFSLLLVGIAAWVYGKYANFAAKKMTRKIATGIALLILMLGGGAAISAARMTHETEYQTVQLTHASNTAQTGTISEIQNAGTWQPFSMDKVNELRAQGKAVFVDFTAKWCLICQTNKVTLHSAEIQKAFAEKNVVPLVADWTKKDSTIGAVLQQLGRSGVPVYLLYPADPTQPPLILPQTLTKATMHEYLDKLNTPDAAR